MDWLVSFLSKIVMEPGIFGALGLFLVSALDEFVAFIPSSLVLTTELLFLKDPLSWSAIFKLLIFVAIPIALGSVVGSLPLFWLVYKGGKPALESVKNKFKFNWADVEKIQKKLNGTFKDELLLFILRLTPLIPTLPVTATAGLIKMNPIRFIVLGFIGISIRVILTLVMLRSGGEAVINYILRL